MLKKLRRAPLLLLAALFALAGAGCWDYKEVEDMGHVMLTSVDLTPRGRLCLQVQVLVPAALAGGGGAGGMAGGGAARGGGARKPYRHYLAEADTLFEAFRELTTKAPRRLFFAHNQVILVGERLARERGVGPVVDFFERNPQIRRDTWLLVARGDLKELMDVSSILDPLPGRHILGVVDNRDLSSRVAATRLGDFVEMLESPGREAYTGVVEMVPSETVSRIGLTPGAVGPDPAKDVRLTGAAVFKGDRLVGFLDNREARGLLWLRGEVRGGPVEFALPGGGGVAVEILRAGRGAVKLEPVLSEGQLSMRVKIKTRVNLVEAQAPGLELDKPALIYALEEELSRAIRGEVEAALARLQGEYRADAFGFGEAVHRKYPRAWRQIKGEWEGYFAALPVEVEVKTSIRRTGLIKKPLVPKKGDKIKGAKEG